MPENSKIEFKITKDAAGDDVHINAMSLKAVDAFLQLLQSMKGIIELTSNHEHIKIGIVEGSAAIIAEGPDAEIAEIENDFTEVINRKSTDRGLVGSWRKLQDLLKANGLHYEANIYRQNEVRRVAEELKTKNRLRTSADRIPVSTSIKFIVGKLIEVGGKNPNIHLDLDNERITISCSEGNAKKANPFLYEQIMLSAWVKEGRKKQYQFCDVYGNSDTFRDFAEFVHGFVANENEIAALKSLHYKCRGFLDQQDYGNFRKFIRLFNHESTDVNTLNTILLVTYPLREHDDLKNILSQMKELFDSKMSKYD
jgi:hypothetical protein